MASQLTSLAEAAARSRCLYGAFHGRALLKLLGELASLDRAVEARRKKANAMTIITFIVMIAALLSVFLSFGVLTFLQQSPLIALVVLCLVGVVRGRRAYKDTQFADMTNEFRETIGPMLRKVLADLDAKEKIRVKLNLGTINVERPDSNFLPPGQRTKRPTDGFVFRENVGSLLLPLANGNRILLRLRNRYIRIVCVYRSSSGKTKRKEKWKKVSTVTAILMPKLQTAPWVEGAMSIDPAKGASAQERLSFKDRDGITTARLDRRFEYKKRGEQPTETVPAAEVVAMLVRLSAMAHRGIQGAKSSK